MKQTIKEIIQNNNVDPYKIPEVVEELKQDYGNCKTQEERNAIVQQYSKSLNKSPHSIRQKLVKLGIYISNTRTSKDGSEVVSKGKLVDLINETMQLNLTESEATSLEKATKQTLKKLLRVATSQNKKAE